MSEKLIGEKMVEQNNLSTQYPLWVIMEDVKVYGQHGDWGFDEAERKEDYKPGFMCEHCEHQSNSQNPNLDFCDNCDTECFDWYKIEERPSLRAGFFFTHQACKDHIEANHYHYTNPRPFCISAWRNPELQSVMQYLIQEAGIDEAPSHYEGA